MTAQHNHSAEFVNDKGEVILFFRQSEITFDKLTKRSGIGRRPMPHPVLEGYNADSIEEEGRYFALHYKRNSA